MVMPSEQQQRTELTKDDDTNWILNKRENKKLWSSLLGISMSSYGNVLSGGSGSGGGGIDMPSYKIRQRMALKIAKKKCAEGYQLSDERCETCDMPLLSMNGQLACKVCPALAKLVTMKTGVGVQEEKVDDARDTTEVIEICSEPRDNKVSADEDDVSSVHAESAASLQMKADNCDEVQLVDNEQALDMTEEECPQNIADSEVDEDGETDESLFVQDVRIHILAEVGGTQDDDQPASQEDKNAIVGNEISVEDVLTSITNSIDKGMIMPTFRIRQRIAMKVAARKTAQGYLVSDERCELCEMPLLSMNDNVICKVCPAIRKWAQTKSEVGVSMNSVDACDAAETVQECSDNKLGEKDGTSEIIQSLCRVELVNAENANDSINEKREVAEANNVKDDGVDVARDDFDNREIEATEAEEEEELFTESIEMPTFRMRQRVAMKIAAKKTAQGYLVSDKRCDLCEMPLFSMSGNSMCKVCPAIEKWARKRETGIARNKAEITVELTESCDNYFFDDTPKQFITTDNVESDNKGCAQRLGVKSGDDTANPEVINTESLVNESKVSSSTNPVECGHSHHRSDDIVNQDPNRGTDENLKDILSPCSVLTSKCNSFEHDAQENEKGVESIEKVTEAISTAVALPDSAIVLLNRLQATSLVDNESDLEEKSSESKDEADAETGATAAVYVAGDDLITDVPKVDVDNAFKTDTSTQDIVGKCEGLGDNLRDDVTSTPVRVVVNEAVPDLDESTMFQLHKHIGCDESLSQELQKAKFELKGILAGCKFEVVTDTVDKLRSIFNCNVSEAEDFRSMFVDERNQSFEYDEQSMLLVMRGWMVTNAHCRRCSKACLMLRPVDGEMMCPKCDDVDAGPAVTFPSNLGSGTPQSEPVIHDSPRHIAFGVPSQLNQWTPVDRECMHCSRQLMRNPNLETDHCPECGPVLTVQVPILPTDHIQPTSTSTKSPALPLLDVPAVPVESQEMTVPVECDTIPPAVNESVDDDTKENDILDAEMLKELKETMRQIEEAKRFLLSKRTPRMMMSPLPPTSNKSLQQISPALMSNTNNHMMPSSVRAGILKPSGYRTPQLTNNSGHRTPQIPGKIFFA